MILPDLLDRIAQIAGEAAALQVATAKGGTRAYFPAKPSANSWLVQAVGQEKAELICKTLVAGSKGDTIPVPLGPMGSRAKQWHAMRRAFAEGASVPEAARLAGVDERTARRHRNGHSGAGISIDDRQGLLPLGDK